MTWIAPAKKDILQPEPKTKVVGSKFWDRGKDLLDFITPEKKKSEFGDLSLDD